MKNVKGEVLLSLSQYNLLFDWVSQLELTKTILVNDKKIHQEQIEKLKSYILNSKSSYTFNNLGFYDSIEKELIEAGISKEEQSKFLKQKALIEDKANGSK